MAGQYSASKRSIERRTCTGGSAELILPAGLPSSRSREGLSLDTASARRGETRGRPRLWHHDYLHLRPLARDLRTRLTEAATTRRCRRVLDVGSGFAPYSRWFGEEGVYVRLDLDAATRPHVVARAEALPFAAGAFDAVLSSQLLGLCDDPAEMGREIARVLRPGGIAWVSGPAAYPYDGLRVEHRFGAPELARLFPGLAVREIVAEGGLLALPFALANVAVREGVRAAERRLGAPARPLRLPAAAWYLAANAAGRALEMLAARGPLASFLGYLDRRLPMNFLVVAEKAS